MPQQLENLLKIYREELEKVTDDRVKKVILYGSYARGDFRPDSDVDVMVLVDANVDNVAPWKERSAILLMTSIMSMRRISCR